MTDDPGVPTSTLFARIPSNFQAKWELPRASLDAASVGS